MADGSLRGRSWSSLRDKVTLADGVEARNFWTTRYRDAGESWTLEYWKSVDAPQRRALIQALEELPAFTSLIELGCNCGPNLRLIRERFPSVAVTGVDINAEAVERGAAYFREAGVAGVKLLAGEFTPTLDALATGSFDVVAAIFSFTCSPPREVSALLAASLRVARRAVVLVEPMVVEGTVAGFETAIPTWRHDYRSELCRLGVEASHIRIRPIPTMKPTDAVLIATLAAN